MLKLNVVAILKQQNKSKYWLFNQLNNRGSISYTNFNALVENKTKSIRYEYIEKLCSILNCDVNDLFVKTDDEQQ
ncbi:MAG: helix-turn-helix transcriptional regulator [Clostridia bacterium]|nr:helix-turn-helix transcriptional regulator [Clostridia bacterium]